MSVNKYLPHLVVLPEDAADAEIANGFSLHPQINQGAIQVLRYVGGWKVVVEKFIKDHVPKMRQYPNRRFLLLIDFDQEQNRLNFIKQQIPDDVCDRVFVLGAFSNPEQLKRQLGIGFESIGEALSVNCEENTNQLWQHELLQHNQRELDRMIADVKPFLFEYEKR